MRSILICLMSSLLIVCFFNLKAMGKCIEGNCSDGKGIDKFYRWVTPFTEKSHISPARNTIFVLI